MCGKDLIAPRLVDIEPSWVRLGQRSSCSLRRHGVAEGSELTFGGPAAVSVVDQD